ncbi:MAG: GNAT family N-acetyltransferase [Anaerolineales bacterium]|nr:GNAT family N-acetyltransferase [Anaerolineales bacterium]
MPQIEIRPAIASDIPALIALDHHYTSEHVWQMEIHQGRENSGIVEQAYTITFRQVRLPRAVRVEYPRSPRLLESTWTMRSGLLVALMEKKPVGYVSMTLHQAPLTTWVTDLAVERQLRRKGIGSALLLAALEWAGNMDSRHVVLEMQPKNYPAIQMALKLGFDLCGYNDRYYANHEIAILFGKSLH